MQVVLTKDVSGLGRKGHIVSVKNGFFRNYLSPKGIAEFATAGLLKLADERQKKALMAREAILKNAKEILEKAEGAVVKVKGKASTKGKLYAAVSSDLIAADLGKQIKVELDATFIKMDHLKEVGTHKVILHLGEGMDAEFTVEVEAE